MPAKPINKYAVPKKYFQIDASASYDTFYKTDRNFSFKMPRISACITPEVQ